MSPARLCRLMNEGPIDAGARKKKKKAAVSGPADGLRGNKCRFGLNVGSREPVFRRSADLFFSRLCRAVWLAFDLLLYVVLYPVLVFVSA